MTSLKRALAHAPASAELSRMLALAALNCGKYNRAADLLRKDPAREKDPALELAYAVALVHAGRQGSEALEVCKHLRDERGDSPELSVLLGQAYAEQGDYPAAIEALLRALRLAPGTPEANASLGRIYLLEGRLDDAAAALRAELAIDPGNEGIKRQLADVVEQQRAHPAN